MSSSLKYRLFVASWLCLYLSIPLFYILVVISASQCEGPLPFYKSDDVVHQVTKSPFWISKTHKLYQEPFDETTKNEISVYWHDRLVPVYQNAQDYFVEYCDGFCLKDINSLQSSKTLYGRKGSIQAGPLYIQTAFSTCNQYAAYATWASAGYITLTLLVGVIAWCVIMYYRMRISVANCKKKLYLECEYELAV